MTKFLCLFCGHKFKWRLKSAIDQVTCPKCGESDVDVA